MNYNQCRTPLSLPQQWLVLWLAFFINSAEANLKLAISSATIDKTSGDLTVKGKVTARKGETLPQNNVLQLFHGGGGVLDTLTLSSVNQKFNFTVPSRLLTELPCEIGVAVAGSQTTKKVAGTRNDCKLIPACKILSPAAKNGPVSVQIGQEVNFKASVKSKDKTTTGMAYEWDFAGGAMGHPKQLNTKASFIRDDSQYRVRFSATDSNGHRCDAFVEVKVGTPPDVPTKVAEQPAPKRGSQLAGNRNDLVVLPFEHWTFQGIADHDFQPNQELAFNPPLNSFNAIVYRKDRLPVALDPAQTELAYSAASNPTDPAGNDSINSTSRNWSSREKSVVDYILDADLQKTDLWDMVDRRGATNLASDYAPREIAWQQNWPPISAIDFPKDEGYWADQFKPFNADNSTNFPAKGADMPGFAAPFRTNDPQPFNFYNTENRWHGSGYVPVTDIDDKGRVNPYPLMRVEATDKASGKTTTTTAVMTTSRDHHCRECHAKGKIAANPATPWTQDAFHYSVNGKLAQATQCGSGSGGGHAHGGHGNEMLCDYAPPQFFEPTGSSIRDQEDAAMKNVYSLHDFYDGFNFLPMRESAAAFNDQGQISGDGSIFCSGCHVSPTRHWPQGVTMWGDYFNIDESGTPYGNAGYYPNYTLAMHKFHGRLQRDPSDANKILREASGVPKLWNPSQGANPNTLFPTVNADGSAKPMEDNCLQCHAGQREQQYRDRMFTAGVTCSDCHGDMLAIGMAYEKPQVGADGNQRRVAYYDEPDCGSCHTGNGNEGKNGSGGFFSAGVMKRAFDAGDFSATTRPPKTERFAVQPKDYGDMPANQWRNDPALPDGGESVAVPVKIHERVYRDSKDKHGDVACGACHGPAHGVWPNRDPKANDNVTAVELQGHTGTILECNVCHTADSFKKLNDLDGGQYSGDSKTGILGGPHNMHPINDVYWWKEAPDDVANASDGTTKGGWHNNYAKMPGANGEDQCAACHGDDHKGTRLSKTPVDRLFVDENGKSVAVKAGTQIACDLCHTLEKSFTNSPAHSGHIH